MAVSQPVGVRKSLSIFSDSLSLSIGFSFLVEHALRHTFASELLNAGMRLECLQQLLGHSSIEMTRRYARLTDNRRKDEYFKAMKIIEKEGIGGHYRRDHSLPAVY